MTTLDQYRQRAQFGGGDAWLEELLIRGQPTGGVRGGHIRIGWTAVGVDGKPIAGIAEPFPVAVSADDPDFAQACSLINAGAIDQVATLTELLAAMTADRDLLQQQVTVLTEQLASIAPTETPAG